jgi:hypothetical protein
MYFLRRFQTLNNHNLQLIYLCSIYSQSTEKLFLPSQLNSNKTLQTCVVQLGAL